MKRPTVAAKRRDAQARKLATLRHRLYRDGRMTREQFDRALAAALQAR